MSDELDEGLAPSAQQALRVELLKRQLDYYNKVEFWGSFLFVGVIFYATRQLLDWNGVRGFWMLEAV